MTTTSKNLRCALLISLSLSTGVVLAQSEPAAVQPPPAPNAAAGGNSKSTAQSEAGEPRANTSSAAGDSTSPAPPVPAARTAPAAQPAARPPAASRPPAGQKPASAADRLNLGTATVTGDREQPKVMYIVPWKKSDIGDLSGKPMNSLLDEALAPVDRDEFKREVAYYDAVNEAVPHNGAPAAAKQGEK